jgi:hypothetical protein
MKNENDLKLKGFQIWLNEKQEKEKLLKDISMLVAEMKLLKSKVERLEKIING